MIEDNIRLKYYATIHDGGCITISRTSHYLHKDKIMGRGSCHLAYGKEYPTNFVAWTIRNVGDSKTNVYSIRQKKWVYAPKKGYRKFAMDNKPNVCERCGEDDSMCLEVHHKDRNRDNNTLSNLAILCANCHRKEHRGTLLHKEL